MWLQVRHPNILALKDTMEVEDKGLTTLYIITEPVTPLAEILKEREIEGAARCGCRVFAGRWVPDVGLPAEATCMSCGVGREEYIAMGLFHVAKAVAFLNNDCKLVCAAVSCPFMVPHSSSIGSVTQCMRECLSTWKGAEACPAEL